MGNIISRPIQLFFKSFRWLLHPVAVFVMLQILWVGVTILWVIWFFNQQEAFSQLAQALGNKSFDFTYGIAYLTAGCILLGMILVGTVMLFVFTQKQTSLIRQQRNFLSSVTHELRSPLASLQLSLETLKKPDVPEAVRTQIQEMSFADIERLVRLIDRILISARLDRGIIGFDTTVETFDLNAMLRDIIRQCLHLDRRIEERVHISCREAMPIRVAKIPLSLILGNLLENAVRYSPAETPIRIAVVRENDQIKISVSDQGMGLTKQDTRKVFRLFHRASAAIEKALPGTGLGLYIVRSMASTLNGRVWAESPGPGAGSTFHVVFPVVAEEVVS